MKAVWRVLLILAVVASAGAAAYYYFVMRQKKPQVELYFDDGSMLAFPGSAPEAGEFMNLARDILEKSPVASV